MFVANPNYVIQLNKRFWATRGQRAGDTWGIHDTITGIWKNLKISSSQEVILYFQKHKKELLQFFQKYEVK